MTHEASYIMNVSRNIKRQCPGVLTQMYLNSLMNFWWYTDLFSRFTGVNQSHLMHDVEGSLVRVLQDGGNPNMTVFDWGQNETISMFLETVDAAVASGITSFFLDKAQVSAKNGEICNHQCGRITQAQATAFNRGHQNLQREVAVRSSGPTYGNGELHERRRVVVAASLARWPLLCLHRVGLPRFQAAALGATARLHSAPSAGDTKPQPPEFASCRQLC